MSRQATEATLLAFADAFSAGDHDALIALCHEDVAHDINGASREIGTDRLKLHLATARAHRSDRLADVVALSSPDGARGALDCTLRGTYVASISGLPKANGQRYALPATLVFEIDDGKITRFVTHFDKQEWLRQISED
jgi:steroid delta-isomerase-like uncharacterized protein